MDTELPLSTLFSSFFLSGLFLDFFIQASDECAGSDGDDVIAVGACGRDWDDVDDAGGMELDS